MPIQPYQPAEGSSPDDWSVHALNVHGMFFERLVEHVIRTAAPPWTLHATQVPVEYPLTGGAPRSFESTLDVWAQCSIGQYCLDLLVECKKNNPALIDWVFFLPATGDRDAVRTVVHSIDIKSTAASLEMTRQLRAGPATVPTASQAWETAGKWKSPEKRDVTKSSSEAVGGAAHQVAIALQCILAEQESLVSQTLDGQSQEDVGWRRRAFVPAVVTTANLKVVRFDPATVDIETGTIRPEDVRIQEVEWLWYHYPLPPHLQALQGFDFVRLHHDHDISIVTKLPVAVVRARYLGQFLQDILRLPQMPLGGAPPVGAETEEEYRRLQRAGRRASPRGGGFDR